MLSDFSNELQLARLRHTNVIRLLGWCIHGEERILVYKFMHNGALDHHIFGMLSLSSNLFYKTCFFVFRVYMC
uniref:Serine-threonine/tyrosine-protein kinase catalytic domain-containing protein n=2 Tax=Aegilops tauschii subsp. strangulata TaxID=200361 RepID=A0A453SRZ6_AEGTS